MSGGGRPRVDSCPPFFLFPTSPLPPGSNYLPFPLQEEEIEYLEEGDLGFDPDEAEDLEDFSGESEGEEGSGSEGALGLWEGVAVVVAVAVGW